MSETKSTVQNAMSLGVGTVISRMLGLGRDILFAYILGAGLIADIFLAAFRVPHFIRRLLYEGGLAMSFIPIFRQTELREGPDKAFTFGRTAIMELSFTLLCVTLLCVYGSEALATLLMPGFGANDEVIGSTSRLLNITLFYMPLAIVASLLFGMLVGLRRFKVPAYGPVAQNIAMLAAGFYALLIGASGMKAAIILCVGLIIGALSQIALPLIALRSAGFKLVGPLDTKAGPSRAFLRAMPMSAFGSASYQMTVILAMFMASFLGPGHISALYFAERMLELPMGLIGVTLATASLGSFAKLSIEEQREELSRQIGNILGICFFLTLPAMVGLIVFAFPIIAAIFGHGEFQPGAVTLTAVALVFYAPALPAVAGIRPLLAALNARGRIIPTVAAALISLGVMLVCARFLVPRFEIAGIAMSATIAVWVNFGLLVLALLRVRLTRFFPWKKMFLYTALSIVMGVVCWFTIELLDRYVLGEMSVFMRLLFGIPVGVGIYFFLAFLVRSSELDYLRQALGLKKD